MGDDSEFDEMPVFGCHNYMNPLRNGSLSVAKATNYLC